MTEHIQGRSPGRFSQDFFTRSTKVCLSALLALWSLTGPPAFAQKEAVRWQQAYARLDAFIEQEMQRANTPGMAVALTGRDGLLRVSTYGFADLKARIPVTPETMFEIGSISKSFTAIALLQLRQEGRFDPQAPVSRYLPWFRIHSRFAPITGHHLLTHTAGIPRDRDDIPSSLYQAVALRERSTGYPPGEKSAYSNVGYQVLGYLLEEIEGQPYAEIIRRRIFEPLGMTSSVAAITHDLRRRLAVGYTHMYDDRPSHRTHPIVEATWLEYGAGDGSIAATAADLAAYQRMLLNRGRGPTGRLLSEESFELFTHQAIKTGEDSYYGYGISTRMEDGHTILGHTGGMVGYSSAMFGDADDGLGAVVFVNGPGNPRRVAGFALQVLRAARHDLPLPPLPAAEPPTRVPKAGDFAGRYTATDGKELVLEASGDSLTLRVGDRRIFLERRREDAFFVDHPDFALFLLRFHRDPESKRVIEATYGPDWYVRPGYVGPRDFEVPQEWRAYPGHYRTQNPWFNNFRVVLRKGNLWMVTPDGDETELVPAEAGLFQLGKEETAERLRFDTIVNGQALRANLSGVNFYRSFTP